MTSLLFLWKVNGDSSYKYIILYALPAFNNICTNNQSDQVCKLTRFNLDNSACLHNECHKSINQSFASM